MFPRLLLLIFLIHFPVSSRAGGEDNSTPLTIRIMTVVICQQGGFLQNLLEPYLAGKNIRIIYSRGHHSEVAAAVRKGEVDIAITHTKVKSMQELAAGGSLVHARTVFSNPMAFLGPRGDPAKISGLLNAGEIIQRIQEQGHCFVVNPEGEMKQQLQDALIREGGAEKCINRDAQDTDEALRLADTIHGYTIWGLHPYLEKGDGRLEPVVIPDGRLLQNLGAWVVAGSPVASAARDLVNYLISGEAQIRVRNFRFPGHDQIQPWWPPTDSSSWMTGD